MSSRRKGIPPKKKHATKSHAEDIQEQIITEYLSSMKDASHVFPTNEVEASVQKEYEEEQIVDVEDNRPGTSPKIKKRYPQDKTLGFSTSKWDRTRGNEQIDMEDSRPNTPSKIKKDYLQDQIPGISTSRRDEDALMTLSTMDKDEIYIEDTTDEEENEEVYQTRREEEEKEVRRKAIKISHATGYVQPFQQDEMFTLNRPVTGKIRKRYLQDQTLDVSAPKLDRSDRSKSENTLLISTIADKNDENIEVYINETPEQEVKSKFIKLNHEKDHVHPYHSDEIVYFSDKASSFKLVISRLVPDAKTPTYSTEGSAGMDLYLPEEITILPFTKHIINLQIAMQMPSFVYGRLTSHSGLGSRHSLLTITEVIDSDYRGPIKYVCFSLSRKPYTLPKHTRIAQMILERYCQPGVMISKYRTRFVEEKGSSRGSKGFGEASGVY